jgi:hypothetical protein
MSANLMKHKPPTALVCLLLCTYLFTGALGYFLGFVPAAIKFKGSQWGMVHAQGMASASQLAIMSGMYTAVHCICQRIRMVEDGWNRGIAGCSTGLVLGWKAGPWSALQSCAGIGLLSALIDLGGGAAEAAEASMLGQLQQLQHEQRQWQAAAGADNPLQTLKALLMSPYQQQQMHWQLAAGEPSSTSSGRANREEAHQRQLLAAVQAAGALPAAAQRVDAAVQQLLAAVPPLAYLSACCSAGPAPLSGDTVNACKLAMPVAQFSSRSGRQQQ